MEKFNNKYRIPSARLQSWDYGADGAYFITICTQNRRHLFGKVVNGEMQLNELGKLAEKYWLEIPNHFSFIELGNFVIMPNHTHGILIIDVHTPNVQTPKLGVSIHDISDGDTTNDTTNVQTTKLGVSADDISDGDTTDDTTNVQTTKLGVSADDISDGDTTNVKTPNLGVSTIGTIINQYKRIVTINARKIYADFGWQSRFHDHIIRDERAFKNIQNYIANNPMNWDKDKFHT